jgi:hypothetical protein
MHSVTQIRTLTVSGNQPSARRSDHVAYDCV